MAEIPYERVHTAQDPSPGAADNNRRKQQPQQPRQLLSCTKCRERKVKCDRTKPCSACCARGSPRDCHFIAEDGNYVPIQQSYELRKLRIENLRLKERLRACQIPIDDDGPGREVSPDPLSSNGTAPSHRRRVTKQKRFQTSGWQDSIYFGSPGLATVVSDFTSADTSSLPLSYTTPHSSNMFRNSPTYPFPTLFSAAPDECFPQLLSCLPVKEELLEYSNAFQRRVHQVPVEMTISEIEHFLSDARKNSEVCATTLALLFGLIALGAQHSTWDKSGGRWDAKVIEVETQKGNVYIAAGMQALRLSSFTHKPSLSAIQTLLMIGSYLTDDGRLLDAYTLFGTTIRLAHSIGLHRHPKYLNPAPINEKDCAVRQKVWWHMLHLDEQISMTLGRPLGISGIGDNPWPIELTTDPVLLRFGEFTHQFTVLARQIMSSGQLTSARTDELTDALRRLLDTVPEMLQFNDTWMHPETILPDLYAIATVYFCKAHVYIILLNRQRTEKHTTPPAMLIGGDAAASFQAVNCSCSFESLNDTYSTQAARRGRTLVLASSEALLVAFMFFYHRDPAALIDWLLAQQAFSSCMILLLDAIECRSITVGAMKAEQAFVVFKDLHDNNVHRLAGRAVKKISWAVQELRRVVTQPSGDLERRQGNTRVQGAGKSEAPRSFCRTDTVMGHTGMFLLEDPGQQAPANEVLAPKTWGDSHTSTQSGGQQQEPPCVYTTEQKEIASSKENPQSSQSAEVMQGLHRSSTLQPSITRYVARIEDDHMQLHGYTAPASPTDFSMLHGHDRRDTMDLHEWQTSSGDDRSIALRLHNELQRVAASADSKNDMFWHHGCVVEGSDGIQGHEIPPSAWSDPRDESHGLHKNNSRPRYPPINAQPPLLRPHYSSPSEDDRTTAPPSRNTPFHTLQYSSHGSDLSPYNHRVSRPAVSLPMSSIAEVAHGYPPTTNGMFLGEQAHMRYPVAIHPLAMGPLSPLMPLAESINIDNLGTYTDGEGFR